MPITADGRFRPGLQTTRRLAEAGLTHIRQVGQLGVIETCRRLRRGGHPVSLNLASSLQADLMGLSWREVPEEIRAELRQGWREALDPARR